MASRLSVRFRRVTCDGTNHAGQAATAYGCSVAAEGYDEAMASLAACPPMMQRARRRLGLRKCRAAWLLGLTVRDYRALEAGDLWVSSELWERMVEVFQWPKSGSTLGEA